VLDRDNPDLESMVIYAEKVDDPYQVYKS
jgi:hypothetical protein